MFNPFKDYFYYTRNERNGTIGLILIGAFFFTIPSFYSFIFPVDNSKFISYTQELPDVAEHFQEEVEVTPTEIALFNFDPNQAPKEKLLELGLPSNTVNAIINYRNKGGKFYQPTDLQKIYTLSETDYARIVDFIKIAPIKSPTISKPKPDTSGVEVPEEYVVTPLRMFPFDPNTTKANTLRRLGLSQDVVNNILRYRAKGGKFYTPESMQKIYGLSKRDYERIAPYIEIAGQKQVLDTTNTPIAEGKLDYIRKNPRAIIDVNEATPEEWQQLRGIGEYYAKKIVKFRDVLGGFSSIEQIGETYGLKPETFASMQRQLKLSPILRHLNINIAEMEEMSKHPYLDWRQAQTIYNYRIQHGAYETVEDLLETKVILEEDLVRLRPYLTVE
ncbi:MAG: helix-hairpin-helix domain-containing protein [Saprospiraceae bacterium]